MLGQRDRARLRRVVISISRRLQSYVVGVTPVDECMILFKLKHALGFIYFIAVYTPTEIFELKEKDMLCVKLDVIQSTSSPNVTHPLSWATLKHFGEVLAK